jgi:hypothetical protein
MLLVSLQNDLLQVPIMPYEKGQMSATWSSQVVKDANTPESIALASHWDKNKTLLTRLVLKQWMWRTSPGSLLDFVFQRA